MKTLDDWLDFLFSSTTTTAGKSLARLDQYLEKHQIKDITGCIITVTGTNGKGSVVRLLEAIYLAAGYRVAAITSPHVVDFCERLSLNGAPVEATTLVDAFSQLRSCYCDDTDNAFDFIHMAFLCCIKHFKPQVTIVEVGVGGRLDSANILDSDAAVITSIGLDHPEFLGDTRESVAWDKAHIARRGCPLICGELDIPHTLYDVVATVGADLFEINNKNNGLRYESHEESWDWLGSLRQLYGLPIPALKLQNAATALMTVESLQNVVASCG